MSSPNMRIFSSNPVFEDSELVLGLMAPTTLQEGSS